MSCAAREASASPPSYAFFAAFRSRVGPEALASPEGTMLSPSIESSAGGSAEARLEDPPISTTQRHFGAVFFMRRAPAAVLARD